MKSYLLSILAMSLYIANIQAQTPSIKDQIAERMKDKKATVGVAVLTDKNEAIRYNNDIHFPLLSVFKFHVALAALDKIDRQNISLDSVLIVKATQLHPDTYSPLREKYPDQDLAIPLKDLLQYSVSLSDNNACDILIEFVGGMKRIDDYICQLGIHDFSLSESEVDMHIDTNSVYLNWSTPSAMTQLLKIADDKDLFAKEYKDFLRRIMVNTETGPNKLKGLLPENTVVGHKTGSSDRNADGMKIADNDAGFIILPDGRKYYIAVFVMNSYETDQSNASIIAEISRMVYDAMLKE